MNKPIEEMTNKELEKSIVDYLGKALANNVVPGKTITKEDVKKHVKKVLERYVEAGLIRNQEDPEFEYEVDKDDPTILHIIPKNDCARWIVWWTQNTEID